MKKILPILFAILLMLLYGCSGTSKAADDVSNDSVSETPSDEEIWGSDSDDDYDYSEESTDPPEDDPVEIEPITLEGTGDNATETFDLESGFAVIKAKHNGSSNFIVHLIDGSGGSEELLINEIGNYDGTVFIPIDSAGEYLLQVKASGEWSAKIDQNIPEDEVETAPAEFKGKGDGVVWVDLEAKLNRFEYSHTGQSNFIVRADGETLLVNEIGKYKGTSAETIVDPGIYAIHVKADGNWTISIE